MFKSNTFPKSIVSKVSTLLFFFSGFALADQTIVFTGPEAERAYQLLKEAKTSQFGFVNADTDAQGQYLISPNLECQSHISKGYICRFVIDSKGLLKSPN